MSKSKKNSRVTNPFYDPSLVRRHAKSKRFKYFTLASLLFSLFFLAFFLGDMIYKGSPAFKQAYFQIEVEINEKTLKSTRKSIDKK